ncbi:uncharacterized protein [Apostichopus japonicus]|uniref:uncharacterized protein n=1 Tax=Stichopus japonicus TaxID=307972 RepID=UPI003AB6224E
MASVTIRRQVRWDTECVLSLLLQDDEVPFTTVLVGQGPVTPEEQDDNQSFDQRALHEIAERLKEIGDNLNKEIQPELQKILVPKMLLEAGKVAYTTFEEWIKEILDKHQHSLTDKSDRHQVALLLMGVKLAFRTAKGQTQLTNTICDRLRDYMVDFVSTTFPNWLNQQG